MPLFPKKKKIPLEKAIALAKRALTPFWLGSRPFLWMDEGTLRVLEPEFQNETWCFVSFDLFQGWSEAANQSFVAFVSRYLDLDLKFCLVVSLESGTLEVPKPQQDWISHHHGIPICIFDPGAELMKGLGLQPGSPNLVIYSKGKPGLRWSSANGPFHEFETQLQTWLRSTDPGLPLEDPDPSQVWPVGSESKT